MRVFPIVLAVLLLFSKAWAVPPGVREELNKARVLDRGGHQAEALAIYEKIFEDHPEYQPVFGSLRNAYFKAGMFDRLIEVCEVAMKLRPTDTSIHMALGEAWAAKGEDDRAKEAWENIITLNPQNRNHYSLVGYELSRHAMYDEAVAVYERGEQAVGEHSFARELSRTYERMGEFGKAADEILNITVQRPKDVLTVERELKRLLSRSGSSVVMDVVKSRAYGQPEIPAIHRILGDLYLMEGEYDEALNEYTRSDAQEPLWELGLKAEREGLHEAALKSYTNLAERRGPYAAAAQFKIGKVLEASQKYSLAMEAYKKFVHDFPTDSGAAHARHRIGVVQLDGLSDAKGALAHFKGLIDTEAANEFSLDSRYMVAECNLRLDRVDEAARELTGLVEKHPSDRALYLLAEVTYFQGNFDSSLALASLLATEYSESDLVNDALSRSVFISANGDDPKLLHRFASIERVVYSRNLDSAVNQLRLFMNDAANSSLADDAMLLLGDILDAKKRYNEAVGAYRDVISLFPDSKLHPEARRKIGEIYAIKLEDREAAIDEFEQILLNHPDYVLTAAVRNRIEELKRGKKE
jgi:tetratricopeptide (TPR) repeat protein